MPGRRANLPPIQGNVATSENIRHTHTPEQFSNSVPINNVSSYVLSCSIGGHIVSFFVDPGAGVSLLDTDVWDRLKSKEDTILPAMSHRLVGVDGAPLNALGSAIIPNTISCRDNKTQVCHCRANHSRCYPKFGFSGGKQMCFEPS